MRNLFLFIWKHYFFFLFLLIESLCIYFLIQNSYYQRATFINSSNKVSANILEASANINHYFNLKTENDRLSRENAELLSRSLESFSMLVNKEYLVKDTLYHQKYAYTSAKVVNNSINRRNNFITLNKGYKEGIKKNMAVITGTGVVGQVKDVSENFCTVMSVLNSKTTISAKLKKDGSYGPLVWEGESFEYTTLKDIPTHVRIAPGDIIVTSAYSLTFPENIVIGTVDSYERKSGEYFYTVKVKLSTDFKKLSHVYIVNNMFKEEQESLEKKLESEKQE